MSEEYNFLDIPDDLYLENIWKNLPIKNIISLCKTNRFMMRICENNDTWRYLIHRDFNKNYNKKNAYHKYVKLNNKKWINLIKRDFDKEYFGNTPELEYNFLNNEKWIDLIRRDFGEEYTGKNAEQNYILLKKYNYLYEINFDPNKQLNMYTALYLRTAARQLKIPGRSYSSKEQIYNMIIDQLNYISQNLDPQLF